MDRPLTFPALGTTAALLVADDHVLGRARETMAAEIDAIDRACSRFRPDSELARVNSAGDGFTTVSARFLEALDVARRAAQLTDGLVDPTVGRAMRALGYDQDFSTLDREGPPIRVRVRRVGGWESIEVDAERSAVRVPAGVELDFGATAKALCVDRAARAVGAETGTAALVSIGGDLALGGPERAGGWSVVVADDHATSPDGGGQRVRIASGGLATSGTTVRRWRRGDADLHHIVDPATGCSADSPWRTVSVAAASCVDANIATTAAIVMGDRAPGWLTDRRLPARLVAHDGSVTFVGGWPAEAGTHP